MGLNDHTVEKDHFEFDEARFDFFFPCCACKHRHRTDFEEPCRTCGHNTRCVSDAMTPNVEVTGAEPVLSAERPR